jgi:hypothetical protein
VFSLSLSCFVWDGEAQEIGVSSTVLISAASCASHLPLRLDRVYILLSKMLGYIIVWQDVLQYECNADLPMVNENYEPNDREEVVLELFKEGRNSAEPWGRVNPLYLREHSELNKGQVEYALRNLTTAGWITQLKQGGLYEFVDDPRDE